MWPLFTYSGFNGDWEHHLWLMWHQSRSIEADLFPSFFLNSAYSVFNPIYAFYGGTLYAVGGALSLVLGNAPVQAYVLIYVLDYAAAFGGWYWLGRMAGLGRWTAIVPGLIFVTSAYYATLIYVRGDWPEFTATSMIPLMVAAGLSVLRADRLRMPAACALALSSVLFFGSHNLTVLLGLTTLAMLVVAVVVCVPEARRLITRRGLLRLVGVVVPAALVSAWYLLPMLAYQSRTQIGSEFHQTQQSLRSTASLVSLGHLLTLSRPTVLPPPSPYYPYAFALALPVLAIVWVAAGVLVLPWRSRNPTWARMLAICSAIAILVAIAMTHVGVLLALPRPYTFVQFSYRLETYVELALSGAALSALVLAKQRSRLATPWSWLAIPVCAVSLAGAIDQIAVYPYPGQDRYGALESYGEVETGNTQAYQDASERVIHTRNLPTLTFPPSAVQGDRVSATVRVRAGTLLATNVAAGSYLLHVSGAKPVGIDAQSGLMVLAVGGAASAASPVREQTITVSTGDGLPIVLGRLLTLCGLAILLAQLLALPAYRLLARRIRAS